MPRSVDVPVKIFSYLLWIYTDNSFLKVKNTFLLYFLIINQVDEWEVGVRGFVYDRQWMIISESGICLTQKQEPQLCLIKPKVDLANGVLMVTAPGKDEDQHVITYNFIFLQVSAQCSLSTANTISGPTMYQISSRSDLWLKKFNQNNKIFIVLFARTVKVSATFMFVKHKKDGQK